MGKIPSSCRKFLFLCCLFCICAAHSQSPVLTTNIGHTGSITSVDVSQDDRYIVSGSEDMTIRLWDHSTGQLIRTCSGHTGIIRQVAFSSDGRQIISCSDDHSLKLWNAFTGKEIRTFRGHPCPVLSFALSPDNRFLVSGGEEDTIRIWDPGTGEVVRKLVLDWEMPEYLRNDADGTDLKPRVIACSFSSDNRRIAVQASALYDSILIWDAASGQRILAFESAGADYEASLAFCREDSLLVGGGPQIVFYDSRTGNEIRKIENGFEVFALSPDERFVAIPYAITDAGTGFELHNLREWSQHIRSLAFTHDGRSLITGCDDHTLHIFQPESFRDFTLQDVQVDGNYALGFRPGDTYVPASAPQCLSLSRDGKYLYTGARSGEVRRWNTEIRKRKGYFSRTHRKGVSAVAAGYGSGYVASGGGDGLIRILDFEAGKEKFLLEAHRDRIASLSFSPDDRWLASGSWDSTIILWDMLSGEPVHTLKGHTGMVTGVEISPDGRKLISSGEDGRIMIWDVNSGTPLQSIDTLLEHITKVGLCPERNLIITANTKGKVRIREADSGEVLQTLPGISFDISRDRSLLAIGERKGSVYVIKLESLVASDGEGCREQYLVNADYYSLFPVEDLVFSQDGRGLYACSRDGVRYHVIADPYQPRILGESHVSHIQSIDISTDGRFLAVGQDNRISLPGIREAAVKLVDLSRTTEVKRIFRHPLSFAMLHRVTFSEDSRYLAAGFSEKAILYDLEQQELLRVFGDSTTHTSYEYVSFSHGSDQLAMVHDFGLISILDLDQMECREFYRKPWNGTRDPALERILTAVYNASDEILLGTDHEGGIMTWDLTSGEEGLFFKDTVDDQIYTSLLSADNCYIYTGYLHWQHPSPVKQWDAATGGLLQVMNGHLDGVYDLALNRAGTLLVSAGFDQTARMWNTASGSEVTCFRGHHGEVSSVALNPEETILFTGSYDGSVKMWDLHTGEETATLYLVDSADWLLVTPQGLFDASPGGMHYMYFTQGMEIIELEQLKERYYEPGLMQKLLGYNQEALRDVRALEQLDLYPEVSVEHGEDHKGLLRIILTNRGGGIGKVSVSLNGKEITPDARDPGSDPGAERIIIEQDLRDHPYLIPGAVNVIGVRASNGEGYLVSRSARAYYTPADMEQDAQPCLYIVSVGVSDYTGEELDLRYAAKDAEEIARALEIGGRRLFGTSSTFLYLLTTDAEEDRFKPTKENILRTFREISTKAGSKDVLVVYLSGHGINWGGQDGDFYYLTMDAFSPNLDAYADPSIRSYSTISSQDMVDMIKQVPALKQVLIVDACASGRVVENLIARRDISSSTLRALERMKDRTGMHIITGCTADAVSYEASRYGQGILTYCLLEGIKGNALRDERFIDVNFLFQMARERVPELAGGIGGIQKPVIFSPYGAESFDIGELSSEDRTRIPLATVKPVFVRSNFQDEFEFEDVLELGKAVDEALNERASRGGDASLIFVNARDFPEACRLSGRYTRHGNKITLNLRIKCEGVDRQSILEASNREELVEAILRELSERIPKES